MKLYLEERIPSRLVAHELGVTRGTVCDWVRAYREQGEAGLHPVYHAQQPRKRNGVLTAVQAKIGKIREDPGTG